MRAHVEWPIKPADAPVFIEQGGGVDEILEEGYLTTILKAHGVEIVGVMIDADANPAGRYTSIRQRCAEIFPDLPQDLPSSGLITENDDHLRFGVWIMPDNKSEGTLETFLRWLVPDRHELLWQHATDSLNKARDMGAECRDCHIAKANLYTWLAWQDPPGQRAGEALTKRVLDPHSSSADPFVAWFRKLYNL